MTYLLINEQFIIMYFYILPFFYLSIIDYKMKTHLLKIVSIILILLSIIFIKDFQSFSDSLFNKSVNFLEWFKIIGWDYVVSSVIICVLIPIIILIVIITI